MNIVFIMNDTFRRDHLGCYGNEWIHTPNLDEFARRSAVFDRFYISSYPTVPNRWDISTGRYGFPFRGWQPLGAKDRTAAQILSDNGVHTQMIWDTPMLGRYNYDYTRGFVGQDFVRGQKSDPWITDPGLDIPMPAQPHKIMNIDHPVLGLMGYLRNHYYRRFDRQYCVGRTISEAMDWLETNHNHESFFLSIDMWQPHEPFDCPWYDLSHYVDSHYAGEKIMFPKYGRPSYMSEAEQQYTKATYAGSCTQVDRWIGNLLDTIDKLKLFRNTLIVWTTDHGHLFGEHDLWGKPGSELGTLFETTTRIPLIVYHPDGIGAGKRFDGIAQPPDILPSLLEFLGIPVPPEIEGKSFWPLLKGETSSHHEAAFSSRFPPTGAADDPSYSPEDATYFDGWVGSNQMVEPSTVTNDNWAYLCSTVAGKSKLYDLQQDPEQRANVIDEHPDIAERMHRHWVEFLESHDAPSERVRPFLEPREEPRTRGDTTLYAFRDDMGQWIAFPNRLDAEQHGFHPDYPRPDRRIETITFDRLVNDNPRNLVFLYRQYYWAEDLV